MPSAAPINFDDNRQELRLDLWLWRARFFNSRAACTRLIKDGGVRLERAGQTRRVAKPNFAAQPDDLLVFMRDGQLMQIRIRAIGTRRGSAREAASLYDQTGYETVAPEQEQLCRLQN